MIHCLKLDRRTVQQKQTQRSTPNQKIKERNQAWCQRDGTIWPHQGRSRTLEIQTQPLDHRSREEIIARVVKIAVRVMFSTHVCTSGGQYYRQTSGGPIGLRSTCAVARLVMKVWDVKWLATL